MNPVARLVRLLRGLFRRRREDDETAEELRFHLEMETENNLRGRMAPGEARRRARLRPGGLDDSMLFQPLPIVRPAQLVDVYTSDRRARVHWPNSYPDYLDIRAANDVFT